MSSKKAKEKPKETESKTVTVAPDPDTPVEPKNPMLEYPQQAVYIGPTTSTASRIDLSKPVLVSSTLDPPKTNEVKVKFLHEKAGLKMIIWKGSSTREALLMIRAIEGLPRGKVAEEAVRLALIAINKL